MKPAATQQPKPVPGVTAGDEVYFRHAKGPASGRVVARGAHGVTIEHEGRKIRVKWEHVLGHKRRARHGVRIVEEGESGMIVEHANGQREYIEVPPEAKEDQMAKALFIRGILAKAAGEPAMAKSHIKQYTRKDGTVVKEHDDKRLAAQPKPAGGSGYPHAPGDTVHVDKGALQGPHTVRHVGKDGAVVTDKHGVDHRVEYQHMKPAAEGAKPAAPAEGEPGSASNPHMPEGYPKSPDEIARALFDTSELEKLPKKVNQPVDSWEQMNEKAQPALKEYTEKLNAVAKALDLVTGKRPQSLEFAKQEAAAKGEKLGGSEADYMLPEHWDDPHGYLFMGPLKGEKRAKEKVEADYNGDWSQLRDMVRATIAVPSVTQLPKVLDELKKHGIAPVQQPKNNLVKPLPGGYRDVNMIVRMSNGMLAELQLHVKPMTLAKEHGHHHYEVTRGLQAKYTKGGEETPKEKWSAEDQATHAEHMAHQERIYNEAWKRATSGGEQGSGRGQRDSAQDGSKQDGSKQDKPLNKSLPSGNIIVLKWSVKR